MKFREIILDFTSLLDVIMIILFWFVLNYQNQAKQQIAQAEQAAAAAVAQAEAQQEQADALAEQAQQAIAIMEAENSAQAENNKAILAFSDDEIIKLNLCPEEEGWYLKVYKGETQKGKISDRNPKGISSQLKKIFEEQGYAPDATMLCIFNYDGYAAGSDEAYAAVTQALREIKTGNRHFYWNENDTSYTNGE